MRSKKLLSMLLAFTLVFSFTSFTGTSGFSAKSSSSSLLQQYEDLKKEQNELKKKLESVKNQKDNESVYISTLSEQIQNSQEQIDVLNEKIEALNSDVYKLNLEVESLQREIDQKQVSIDTNWETFKQRLRALYMAGDASTLEMLLSANSISDFMMRSEMLKSITKHDTDLIDSLTGDMTSLEESKAEVESKIAEIEAKQEELNTSKAEYDSKQNELTSQLEESQKLVNSLKDDEESYQLEMEASQEEIDHLNAELSAIYGTVIPEDYENVEPDSDDGTMTWPLPGFSHISSDYGSRWGSFHKGIDISGGGVYGHNIVAARAGTVLSVSSGGTTYGKYLIIQHDGSISTLYAHCSAILVSRGQTVSKGQVVARVGDTGRVTGPHLHFEVRVNGSYVNPWGYL